MILMSKETTKEWLKDYYGQTLDNKAILIKYSEYFKTIEEMQEYYELLIDKYVFKNDI